MLACSLSLFGAGNAFADDNTDVSLVASSSNLSVTIPLDMTAAIDAEGNLTYPTEGKFINNSVFGIHVSNLTITDASPYSVVASSSFDGETGSNVLWTTIQPRNATPIDITSGDTPVGEWYMEKGGVAGNELPLTFAGKVKNLTQTPKAPAKAYHITWTVAAGNNI